MAFIQEESGYYAETEITAECLCSGMVVIRDNVTGRELAQISSGEAIRLRDELINAAHELMVRQQ